MVVFYAPSFVRLYKNLPVSLKQEVKEKIALFYSEKNHEALHVHKLSGKLRSQYGFRVNYKTRVVFVYTGSKPRGAILLTVGDHEIYSR